MPVAELSLSNNGTRHADTLSLPAYDVDEAGRFLDEIGTGGLLGAGTKLWRTSVNMPLLREEYKRKIAALAAEVDARKARGQDTAQIARWAAEERRRIANDIRLRSGIGTRVLFEVRDWSVYGPGGRTYDNLSARYRSLGFSGPEINNQIVQGAARSNVEISRTALDGARYLRNGGRVAVVVSAPITAYTLVTTPDHDLERVLHEEAGGFIGGSIGSGAAVGLCLVFGIATSGWGLLACGAVGGLGGGIGGSYAGSRLYYSSNRRLEHEVKLQGVVPANQLSPHIPRMLCRAC